MSILVLERSLGALHTVSSIASQQTVFLFCFEQETKVHRTLPTFYLLSTRATSVLDIIVRPHGWHVALERLKRELECRARVPDLELLQHARMQNA